MADRSPTAATPLLHRQGAIVAAVAIGGALGALARWGLGLAFPTPHGAFPTTTLVVNLSGCLLMGILVVHVAELRTAHPILRPFLGVGVLGGYTTFSTFAVDAEALLAAGRLGPAIGYLVATTAGSVAAAWLGLVVARRTAGTR